MDTVALGFQKQQPWNQKIAGLANRPGLIIGETRLTAGVVSQCETKRSQTMNSSKKGTLVRAAFVIAMHAATSSARVKRSLDRHATCRP